MFGVYILSMDQRVWGREFKYFGCLNLYFEGVPFHNLRQFCLPLCRDDMIIFCSDIGKQSLVRILRKLFHLMLSQY